MTTTYHKCARCGVADEDVRLSLHTDSYFHAPANMGGPTPKDMCLAALQRENAVKDAEIAALREQIPVVAVAFADWRHHNCSWSVYGMDIGKGFAAFRETDEYRRIK